MDKDVKWVMIAVSIVAIFGFGGMAIDRVVSSNNETACKVAAVSSHRTADEIVKICKQKGTD